MLSWNFNDDDVAHRPILAIDAGCTGRARITLRCRIAGATAATADAGQSTGATCTTNTALATAGIGGIRRCRDAMRILNRHVASIAAGSTVTTPATIAAIAAMTTVFVVLAAMAVAAIAARTALSAWPAWPAGTAVAAMGIDIHARNEFSDRDSQRATILTRKSVGAIGRTRAIVASATDSAGIVAIPVADCILSLPACATGLASGTAMTIAARIAVYVNIVRRHYLSPVWLSLSCR